MKYKVILADPPWSFDNKKTGGSMRSGSQNKYPTMSIDELKNLIVDQTPIHEICDKNSLLFLWVPVALLPNGLEILSSWGYKYKTTVFWIKTGRLGMGFTFRNQVEPCLIGVKGKMKPFRSSKQNTVYAKPGKHSEKPDEFFDLIEPELDKQNLSPRIELFSRKCRVGWDGWGFDYPQ